MEHPRLAAASDKGTLIRVFDTQSGQMQQEPRRGADRAEIYSICFNGNSQFLATPSDKGAVHIFSLSPQASGGSAVEDGSGGFQPLANPNAGAGGVEDDESNHKSGLVCIDARSMVPCTSNSCFAC